MILQDGVDSVTARKAAERTGYSLAPVYNHFRNLDELLRLARNRFITDIADCKERRGNFPIRSGHAVKRQFRTYADDFIERPGVYRFLHFHALTKIDRQFIDITETPEFSERFATMFGHLCTNPDLSAEQREAAFRSMICMMRGLLTLSLSDNDGMSLDELRPRARCRTDNPTRCLCTAG